MSSTFSVSRTLSESSITSLSSRLSESLSSYLSESSTTSLSTTRSVSSITSLSSTFPVSSTVSLPNALPLPNPLLLSTSSVSSTQLVAAPLPVVVEVWNNHSYSDTFVMNLKNVVQNNDGSCIPIPTAHPLLFFATKSVAAGDVMVKIRGTGLQCVPQTCVEMPMLVLETESICEGDGRNPFCGHPKPCILTAYDISSCSFTCKRESTSGSIHIAVYFKPEGNAHSGNAPQFCGINMHNVPYFNTMNRDMAVVGRVGSP